MELVKLVAVLPVVGRNNSGGFNIVCCLSVVHCTLGATRIMAINNNILLSNMSSHQLITELIIGLVGEYRRELSSQHHNFTNW